MELYQQIIEKTWADTSFRELLFSNPKEALAQMGQSLPENMEVQIHQDTLDTMNFVLLDEAQAKDAVWGDDPVGRVSRKALDDAAFRERLLSNPHEAVQESLGLGFPGELRIYANTPNQLHLVMPVNPDFYGELSDSDLAVVAGGKGQYTEMCKGISSLVSVVGKALPSLGPLLTGGTSLIDMASKLF
ncbi:MAG: NHLP leader peptide family RiPP precursor [SAR324 cluster bacterium]|nr:NHLP leader peptide family RiPP precursor [SAR324 cluster bacterium]